MRKLIMLGLMAATVFPAVAVPAAAQSRAEIQRDREHLREQQRELRDAQRYGDRRDVREERRDVHDARRDLRESQRDYHRDAWRDHRRDNRHVYSRGKWNAPFKYRKFKPGARIGHNYAAPRYVIADPWRYRLPRPAPHQRWVRHYDDMLLVDARRGVVVDVFRNFFW